MDQAIITPAERERLTRYLAASNEQLLKLPQALSPAELDYKPAPDHWSAAENVEHLAVVENIILDRITRRWKHQQTQSEAPGKGKMMSSSKKSKAALNATSRRSLGGPPAAGLTTSCSANSRPLVNTPPILLPPRMRR
jgi:uncharacterized damage-inducible protein DinB